MSSTLFPVSTLIAVLHALAARFKVPCEGWSRFDPIDRPAAADMLRGLARTLQCGPAMPTLARYAWRLIGEFQSLEGDLRPIAELADLTEDEALAFFHEVQRNVGAAVENDRVLAEQAASAEVRVETVEQLRAVLNLVTFAPSCVDMGWSWTVTPATAWHDDEVRRDGWLIATTFQRPDRDADPAHPKVETGAGRPWWVACGATESSIVKTAWVAAKMVVEHELHEAFKYRDRRLFDPHYTVDQLTRLDLPAVRREEA
jgi:hypothetical protein